MSTLRFKRPELQRSEPIRHWSGLFGNQASSAPESPTPGPPAGAARGIELGYQVIDAYLQQGQAFARGVAGARQSQGPLPPQAAGPAPQQMTEQLVRSTLDWFALWFDYMQTLQGANAPWSQGSQATRAAPAPHAREVGAFDIEPQPALTPAAPAPEPVPRTAASPMAYDTLPSLPAIVSIQLASKQRTEVTLDIKPLRTGLCLTAYDLRAADGNLPRITEVAVELQEARVLLRIAVPDDQPAGVYSGLLIDDATQLPHGTLSVRVFEPSRSA